MASESEDNNITIPPEIITDILHRLPAKSLGRFRCVSKDYLSLISTPNFIKTHQKTLNQNHIILISREFSLYSLPFHSHDTISKATKLRFDTSLVDLIYHGSCNGLVLVSAYYFHSAHKLVVLNPTTREFIELPLSGNLVVDDLLEIEIMYGFGYDSVTDDYKVVTISFFHNHYLIPHVDVSVHVYSVRTSIWKWVVDSPYDDFYGMSFPGVFVSGFLHWFARKGSDGVITAFSLADEKFMEVPLPDFRDGVDIMSRNDCRLVVFDEKLAIILENEGEVWLMNEYGNKESWTKIIFHGLDEIQMDKQVIPDENNDKVLVSRDLVLRYDLKEKTFYKSFGVPRNLKDLKVSGAYVESLVSPIFS